MQSWKILASPSPLRGSGVLPEFFYFLNFELCIERFLSVVLLGRGSLFLLPTLYLSVYRVGNQNWPPTVGFESLLFCCGWILKKSIDAKLQIFFKTKNSGFPSPLRGPCQNFSIFKIYNFALNDFLSVVLWGRGGIFLLPTLYIL